MLKIIYCILPSDKQLKIDKQLDSTGNLLSSRRIWQMKWKKLPVADESIGQSNSLATAYGRRLNTSCMHEILHTSRSQANIVWSMAWGCSVLKLFSEQNRGSRKISQCIHAIIPGCQNRRMLYNLALWHAHAIQFSGPCWVTNQAIKVSK